MTEVLTGSVNAPAIPLYAIAQAGLEDWRKGASDRAKGFVEAGKFLAKAGQVLIVTDAAGRPDQVLVGLGASPSAAAFRALASKLPPGDYWVAEHPEGLDAQACAVQFALGAYRFDRYKQKHGEPWPRLVVSDSVDLARAQAIAHAAALARDMVNTPANDMGPRQIETIAREIAEQFKARITVTTGTDLLADNYPAVHAVGRAAGPGREPRIIELAWNEESGHPLVAIVGKGVTFDTGGLDIKPSAGMRLMKKDMGGAAHALALARMVMAANLPVRLAVLVPAVENAISGDAMRPGDVIASRAGLSIEVGNTDAEGRLILADALARASELEPDLTIDMATLTGAARIALGPLVIPYFTDDEQLAAEIADHSRIEADPLWRMPLWPGYEDALDSDIADIANDPQGWAQAGCVTAALFLKRFAPRTPWVHLDIFAWNAKARPGHPTGGEVQAIRALFALLQARYG